MKVSKTVTVCNNCGVEDLDDERFATVTLTIDGHVEYIIDLCRERCLPPLVELGRRQPQQLEQLPPAEVEDERLTCLHCGRTFKTANGLKVHIARMHS